MPDASGKIKGIALSGKAAASWERIFAAPAQTYDTFHPLCGGCTFDPHTCAAFGCGRDESAKLTGDCGMMP